jgi:hypothetical protein
MTTTNHLSSASAVEVTNNQPKENAITTITTTEPTWVQFTPDTEANKRLKVAQMAKKFSTTWGVIDATVGSVTYFNHIHGAANERGEVVQVRYSEDCELATKAAGFKFFITRAWFNKYELVGVELSASGEEATHLMFSLGSTLRFVGGEKTLTVGGVELSEREVRDLVTEYLRYDGDQYRNATKMIADREKRDAQRAEHEARVQAAYAERQANGDGMRSQWALDRAKESELHSAAALNKADAEGHQQYRVARDEALNALKRVYHIELWAICLSSLNHLRCETNITNGDDPYGFVTLAEVSYHILTKWAEEGWHGEKEIRHAIATEFIRQNLS